jgi:hypothetical protein
VSILSRFSRDPHLDEAALADLWTAAVADAKPGVEHPHLTACAECRARLAAFSSWLDGIRNDAVVEADAVFPAERLATQQAQILRRLETLERPARVIAFPRLPSTVQVAHSSAQRWMTAAAAAAFIVGLAAGQLFDLRRAFERTHIEDTGSHLAQATPAPRRSGGQPVSASSINDESLLYGTASDSVPELQSLDAITPRARDVDQPR